MGHQEGMGVRPSKSDQLPPFKKAEREDVPPEDPGGLPWWRDEDHQAPEHHLAGGQRELHGDGHILDLQHAEWRVEGVHHVTPLFEQQLGFAEGEVSTY